MAQANAWQDKYAISTNASITSGGTTDGTFGDAAGEVGLDSDIYQVYTNGHPDLLPGQNFVNTEKATGTSTRLARVGAAGVVNVESRPSTRAPNSTWECDATPKLLGLVMWLLFQSNVTEGITPFEKVYLPPTTTTTTALEAFVSILRSTGDPAESQVIHGCVVPHINLSASEGDTVTASMDFIGRLYAQDFDASSLALAPADEAPLMWQDCTATLGGTAVNLNGFSFDMNANLVPKFHNSQTIIKYVMGMMSGSGTINMPLAAATVGDQIQRALFIAGTPTTLKLAWGTPAAAGYVAIEANVQYSGAPYAGEDELVADLAFDIVRDDVATIDEALQVTVVDEVSRGI